MDEVNIDALPEIGGEVDLDALPEIGGEVDLDALPEIGGADGEQIDLDALPDLDAAPNAGRPKIGYNEMAALNYEAQTGADAPENAVLKHVANAGGNFARGFAAGQMSAAQQLADGSARSDAETGRLLSRMLYGTVGGTVASWFSTPDALEEWDRGEGARIADPAARTAARNAYAAEIARAFIGDRTRTQTEAGTELATRDAAFGARALADLETNVGYMLPFALGPVGIAAQFGANAWGTAEELSNDRYALDEDGNLVVAAKGDGAGMAAVKGLARAGVETGVELVGGKILGKVLGGLGKRIGGAAARLTAGRFPVVRETAGKLVATRVGQWVAKAATELNRLTGWTSRKLHLDGLGDEYLEEWLDPALAATLGVDKRASEQGWNPVARWWDAQKEFFTAENQARLVTSLVLLQGAGGFVAWCAEAPARRMKAVDNFLVSNKLMTADEVAGATNEEKAQAIEAHVNAMGEGEVTKTLAQVTKWAAKMGASFRREVEARAPKLSDEQELALDETIPQFAGEDARLATRVKDKIRQKVAEGKLGKATTDGGIEAIDDPQQRENLVMQTIDEVLAEDGEGGPKTAADAQEEERAARRQKAHDLRGKESDPAAQLKGIEEMNVTSWEQAEADGLTERDRFGRFVGGARRALNIAIHGTAKLKEAVRQGTVDGETAEALLTAAQCELGARPKEEQDALVDGILERANGDAALARQMAERLASEEAAEDGAPGAADDGTLDARLDRAAEEARVAAVRARNPNLTEEEARAAADALVERPDGSLATLGETLGAAGTEGGAATPPPKPQTAQEGAAEAKRLAGARLRAQGGGVMGCAAFPDVRVQVSSEGVVVEGLTAEVLGKPENAADAAALVVQIQSIAARNGVRVRLADEDAAPVFAALYREVREQGLAKARERLDLRSKLFALLFRTTLGNGVTYDEASFKAALERSPNGRPFVNNHGQIYGMMDGEGVLHFNPAAINFNTPIHEYGHLALAAVKGANRALWERGMRLVRESAYYADIRRRSETPGDPYAYLKGNEEGLCDEALATLIGDRGERLVLERGVESKLKAWLKEVWRAFKGALGIADLTEEQIERMTLGEFVDAINAELLRGGEFGKRRRPSGLNRRQAAEARARREMNQHYADLGEKEAFERWEASGMGVVEYIRARAEEGAPEFDLDWELAREVDRDNARGLVENLEAAGLLPAARTAEDGDARAVREEMEELGLMSAARFAAGREYDEVVARYTNADGSRKQGWMKAPNGKPTTLTERQWVQARTPAFKKWFGDWENDPANASKVVDANGEPLVVYHGSKSIFSVFDTDGRPGTKTEDTGAFFTDRRRVAVGYGSSSYDVSKDDFADLDEFGSSSGGGVYPTFLNIRNPLSVDCNGNNWDDVYGERWRVYNEEGDVVFASGSESECEEYCKEHEDESLSWDRDDFGTTSTDDVIKHDVRNSEHDGAVFENVVDNHDSCELTSNVYVVLDPAQIKSATENAGAFDAGNPDIRFHAGRVNPNLAEDVRTAIAGDVDGKPVGRRREVAFSEMPDALKAVGIPDLPIRTRTDIVRKLRRDHGFTERQIVALPEAYGQPAAVFLDGKAYVVLTGMQVATRGGSEKPVMVVLRESVDRNGRHEFLASAYPREESNENLYTGLARSGKMLFLDKNKVAVIGLNGRTISTLNEQADGNHVKTPEDLSSAVSGRSMPNSGGGVNGGAAKFAVGRLYTGSAADYERPSLVHVGSGEGSQVYGWGLYASDVRGIAEQYAGTLRDAKRRNVLLKGAEIDAALPFRKDVEAALRNLAPGGRPEDAAKRLEGRAADLRRRMAEGDGAEGKLRRMADRDEAAARWIRDNAKDLSVEESKAHIYEQTFFADRAPGDESHLLKWYEPVSEEQMGWILRQAEKEGLVEKFEKEKKWKRFSGNFEQFITDDGRSAEAIYEQLSESGLAHSDNKYRDTSEFLARAGIDGVKYPADSYGGKGVKDGDEAGWNYVSFRDDNIRVDHKWTDGVARFHVGRGEDAAWRRVVDEYVEGRLMKRQDAIVLPRVPVVISRVLNETLGVATEGRKVVISSDCLSKAMDGKHRIPAEEMKRLATSLDAPLAVFQSRTRPRDSVTALVPIRDQNGGISSVVPIDYTAKSADGGDVLRITSVYGKTSAEAVQSWIDQGYLLYADRENISRSFPHRLQLPGRNKTANRFLDETDFSREALGMIANPDGDGNGGAADARLQAGEAVAMDAVEVVYDPRAQVLPGGVRVAADAGRGERTPGGLASSRELSAQRTTPLSRLGRVNAMALPLSEMVRLYRDLTGSAVPPRVARRLPGGAAATHTRAGALAISADVLGLVDRTDAAKEKARLKEHGFFRDEDADWCATQLPAAVRAERERSDRQLGEQLRLLGERRVRGAEAGGHAAARGVFAHELAKVVMEMPRASTGVIGRVQKIGDGIRREVAAAAKAGGASAESAQRGEAGAFLDWAHGSLLADPQTGAPVGRGAALSLRELTDEMFGAFLTMPQELHDRAPTWYDAIVKAVTDEPKLAKAYRELSLRGVSSRAHQAVLADIQRSMERATEARLRELESDANEPISAGSAADDAKEATLVALHDRMAPVVVRIDAKARICLKAKRTALRAMRARGASPSEIRLAEQEIDRYTGEVARLKGNIELSRTAYERGAANEGMIYFYRMLEVEDEATLAGLTEADKSLYLDQMRVIETQGRSGARGEDPQQARMILGDLARKLGPEKWAALERYGREFSAVIEQEVLDNPGLARMLGKGLVDYMRTQVHYVATKRTFSVEELDAIDAARDAARAAGVNGGDDVVSQMYALMGKGGGNALGGEAWKKPLVGSFRDKVEPRAATWDKHEKIMQAVRRNELVIAMRDAFLATGVEGVRDVARVDRNKVRAGERYGYLDYMEDGQPRTLVVPKQIADAFAPRQTGKFAKALLAVNNLCRKLYIDFNLGYSIVDMSRNLGSIEKNMPGMHETPVKSALRAAGPGVAGLTQVVAQSLVKRSKTLQRAVDGLSVVPGFGNTVYQTMGDAHKVVGYLTDPTGFQLRLKEAKDRGDAAAEAEAYRIVKLAREVMRANMFVSFTARQTGRATEGFANDVMNRHGLYTLAQEIDAEGKKSLARKLAESKWNVFQRNRQKIEYNDLFAKTVAYLHDRQAFGDVRTVQESGVVVKRNVGLGEVERRGSGTHVIQLTVNQFFNAIEKGIVQHARALYERPVETILKDLNSWTGRFIGGLASTGVVTAALRALYDDDEDKVRASALGTTYDYLKAWERAHLNCSDYIRENYNVLPLWNSADGYTSVVLALPLDDQDRLFSWSAEQTAGLVAEKCGILGAKPRRSFAGAAMAATVKSLAPDLTFSTAIFDFVRVLFAQADDANPRDSFRGAPMYDPTVWGMRNESWEDRWDFTLATGKILWNAVGGRTFYQFGYEGVDNGEGDAPKWLGLAVNRIPVLSPTLKRFVKIQVGSPDRDLRPLADEVRRVGLVVKRCRRKLMEESAARGGSLNEVDPKRYAALLEDWQRTYGLGDGAMSEIEAGFLNGWAELDRQDEVKRRKAMQTIRRAGRLGIEEADRYILGGQL